jgi:release factor glutamine methyltransferase
MTVQDATYFVLNQLRSIYEDSEASQITDWVMEKITGSKKTERMLYKSSVLTHDEEIQIQSCTERLVQHEPVQYVLNESWFSGFKFYVDKNVLIPRPETEELVEWIITNCKFPVDQLKILDIGSGSGCIPVSLKRRIRRAEVWSCDISPDALEVSKKNATALGTDVNFLQLDFLDEEQWERLPSFDIIVSNPPYVPEKDKEQMQANVLQYEPATALFVTNNDPLVFYKAIAEFGKTHLNKSGSIYTEIHEGLGEETIHVFQLAGYKSELKKDMQQKDRMLKSGLTI